MEGPERTLKLVVEYDGTDFHGWQVQPGLRTVQGTLEDALTGLLGHRAQPMGAGRTDAGVHALGQVASLKTRHPIPCHGLLRAMGGRLPRDVAVCEVEEAAPGFNARFSARGKWYRFRLLISPIRRALLERYAHRVRGKLDLDRMRAAAAHFAGTHDFRSLAKECDDRPTTRTLFSVDVTCEENIVFIDVRGDGFLYNMVRAIAGTLVEVGRGRWLPEEVVSILEARDRGRAGPTLPGRGLFLMRVDY